MTAATLIVGWSVTGRVGHYLCPVHKGRDVEVLPVSLTTAEAGDLRCHVCGELLARAEASAR